MITWIAENAGTVIVAFLLICVVCAVIVKMVRDKKKGKSSCGCNCGHCAMSGSCHHDK